MGYERYPPSSPDVHNRRYGQDNRGYHSKLTRRFRQGGRGPLQHPPDRSSGDHQDRRERNSLEVPPTLANQRDIMPIPERTHKVTLSLSPYQFYGSRLGA
jgi:hypothetical protein